MKMETTVSSETSAIRTQTPGNYQKRNKLHLENGESLKTRKYNLASFFPLGMQSEGNTQRNGEPTFGFFFLTMLQHTGQFWLSIS